MFEHADGGVIFLDEIGELSLEAQAKLLRVVQDHRVQRVGSLTPREVDVRVIAATHRNLQTMVQEGRFREDHIYPGINSQDPLQQLHPVHFRHYEVNEDKPWPNSQEHLKANFGIICRQYFESFLLEYFGNQLEVRAVIINDQQRENVRCAH
jgi:predicted ATP-dependent protease